MSEAEGEPGEEKIGTAVRSKNVADGISEDEGESITQKGEGNVEDLSRLQEETEVKGDMNKTEVSVREEKSVLDEPREDIENGKSQVVPKIQDSSAETDVIHKTIEADHVSRLGALE